MESAGERFIFKRERDLRSRDWLKKDACFDSQSERDNVFGLQSGRVG